MKGEFFVFVNFVKNLLFPVYCAGCGAEGEWLCERCLEAIKLAEIKIELVGYLDGLIFLFDYKNQKSIAKLIHNFKYGYAREIKSVWQRFIGKCNLRNLFGAESLVVIPVPLHPRRERERGFNQSQILSELVNEIFHLPVLNQALIRTRYTSQQAKLSGEQRKDNLENAFKWKINDQPAQNILLVDDVYTTGATMQECARILKQNGAQRVWGFVLAKRTWVP